MKRFALSVTTLGLLFAAASADAAVVVETAANATHGDIFTSDPVVIPLSTDGKAPSENAADAIGDTIATYAAMLPEPSEWVLLVAGFGIIGYAMRSRKRAHVSFN